MRRSPGLLAGALALHAVACGGAGPAATTPPVAREAPIAAAPPAEPAAPIAACARRRPGTGPLPGAAARQGSTVAIATDQARTIAYVADEDDDAVHTVDVDARKELAVTPLGGSPAQLLVLADGRVAAVLRDRNRVVILEPRERADLPLEPRCAAPVAAEPVALAASPDGRRLVVTSGWGHALSAFDAGDLRPEFTVDLPREPRAVIVDRDGSRAFVAHVVGGRLSSVDLAEPRHPVHAIDLRGGFRREGGQGYALAQAEVIHDPARSAGPSRLFAPMVSVDPGEAKLTQGYGSGGSWGPLPEIAQVGVVDATSERVLNAGVDFARRTDDCLLPRAAAAVGDALLVTCLGIDALLELDARALRPLTVERRRVSVPAGPTGVAADEAHRRALVFSQFARELTVVPLGAASEGVARIPLARREDSRVTAPIARGRALFHATFDPRVSRDGRACASCHPDGREDALTWSTPEGPRQTIMLAGRVAGSPPYGWFGQAPTLKAHVTRTLQRLGGRGFAEEKDRPDFDALIAYLGTMRGPTLAGAPASAEQAGLAARGRELFDDPRQGCAACHLDGGTDRTAHDVKSGKVIERSLKFDTPSLRFVGGTAPYFHDGRYPTLLELLEKSDGTMGHSIHLSRRDLVALETYLETL
jgi:hypothetical protein